MVPGLLGLLALLGAGAGGAGAPPAPLRFRNGTLRLLQFADLHYGAAGAAAEREAARQQRLLLELEQPDAVVLTGDNIAPNGALAHDNCLGRGGSAACWRAMVEPMVRTQTRWAAVFGAHDEHGDLPKERLMEVDRGFPLSLSNFSAAAPHYWLPVLAEHGPQTKAVLYMFHSSPEDCWQTPHAWDSAIGWYRRVSAEVSHRHVGVAFMHVPLPEYANGWNSGAARGDRADETVSCLPPDGRRLFELLAEKGAVSWVVAGHDHANDFAAVLEGITLAYGRKTGPAGYFRPGALHGARVIELRETAQGATVRSWIRQVDGRRVWQGPDRTARHTVRYCCQTARWYDLAAARRLIGLARAAGPALRRDTGCTDAGLAAYFAVAALDLLAVVLMRWQCGPLRPLTQTAVAAYLLVSLGCLVGPAVAWAELPAVLPYHWGAAAALTLCGAWEYRAVSRLGALSAGVLLLGLWRPALALCLLPVEAVDFVKCAARRAHPYAALRTLLALYALGAVVYLPPRPCLAVARALSHAVLVLLVWNWQCVLGHRQPPDRRKGLADAV